MLVKDWTYETYVKKQRGLTLATYRINNPTSDGLSLRIEPIDYETYITRNLGNLFLAQNPVVTTAPIPPAPPLPPGLVDLTVNPTGNLDPTGTYQFENTFSVFVDVHNQAGTQLSRLGSGATSVDLSGNTSFYTILLLGFTLSLPATVNVVAGTTLRYLAYDNNTQFQYYNVSNIPIGSAISLPYIDERTYTVPSGATYILAYVPQNINILNTPTGTATSTLIYIFYNPYTYGVSVIFAPNSVATQTLAAAATSPPITGITGWSTVAYFIFSPANLPTLNTNVTAGASLEVSIELVSLGYDLYLQFYRTNGDPLGSEITIPDSPGAVISTAPANTAYFKLTASTINVDLGDYPIGIADSTRTYIFDNTYNYDVTVILSAGQPISLKNAAVSDPVTGFVTWETRMEFSNPSIQQFNNQYTASPGLKVSLDLISTGYDLILQFYRSNGATLGSPITIPDSAGAVISTAPANTAYFIFTQAPIIVDIEEAPSGNADPDLLYKYKNDYAYGVTVTFNTATTLNVASGATSSSVTGVANWNTTMPFVYDTSAPPIFNTNISAYAGLYITVDLDNLGYDITLQFYRSNATTLGAPTDIVDNAGPVVATAPPDASYFRLLPPVIDTNLLIKPTGSANSSLIYSFNNAFDNPVIVSFNTGSPITIADSGRSSLITGISSWETKMEIIYTASSAPVVDTPYSASPALKVSVQLVSVGYDILLQFANLGGPIGSPITIANNAAAVVSTAPADTTLFYFTQDITTIDLNATPTGNTVSNRSYKFYNSYDFTVTAVLSPGSTVISLGIGETSSSVTGFTSYVREIPPIDIDIDVTPSGTGLNSLRTYTFQNSYAQSVVVSFDAGSDITVATNSTSSQVTGITTWDTTMSFSYGSANPPTYNTDIPAGEGLNVSIVLVSLGYDILLQFYENGVGAIGSEFTIVDDDPASVFTAPTGSDLFKLRQVPIDVALLNDPTGTAISTRDYTFTNGYAYGVTVSFNTGNPVNVKSGSTSEPMSGFTSWETLRIFAYSTGNPPNFNQVIPSDPGIEISVELISLGYDINLQFYDTGDDPVGSPITIADNAGAVVSSLPTDATYFIFTQVPIVIDVNASPNGTTIYNLLYTFYNSYDFLITVALSSGGAPISPISLNGGETSAPVTGFISYDRAIPAITVQVADYPSGSGLNALKVYKFNNTSPHQVIVSFDAGSPITVDSGTDSSNITGITTYNSVFVFDIAVYTNSSSLIATNTYKFQNTFAYQVTVDFGGAVSSITIAGGDSSGDITGITLYVIFAAFTFTDDTQPSAFFNVSAGMTIEVTNDYPSGSGKELLIDIYDATDTVIGQQSVPIGDPPLQFPIPTDGVKFQATPI